jgi:hypothetical protein
MKLTPDTVAKYVDDGNEVVASMARQYIELMNAVHNVYYAAQWTADRTVNEKALWTELRDKAGFTPGHSPKPTPLFEKLQAVKNTLV